MPTSGYKRWIASLKSRIRQSQTKAAVHINSALIELYWSIGADIVARQAEAVWGSGIFNQISKDIRAEFPDIKGFSKSNLYYMKQFYLFYSQGDGILQQLVAKLTSPDSEEKFPQVGAKIVPQTDNPPAIFHQLGGKLPALLVSIPWRHHVEIMTHCKTVKEAVFYIQKTIENGWSRAMLMNCIETGLYKRQGKSINNFARLLPEPQSDLARETLKDPYNFDFITLTEGYKERELENALTENLTRFLLELGQGFAFVGRQVPVQIGRKEYFIDLLFYHLELCCYVVIELKAGEFEAEHTGKLGLYVSAINHQRRKTGDNPTIGLLICKTKDNIVAQYSLESTNQPIGISEYQLSRLLPENYKSALPSIEEIEAELNEKIMDEKE